MGEWREDKEYDMIMIDDDYDVYEWYDLLVSVCMDASPHAEDTNFGIKWITD